MTQKCLGCHKDKKLIEFDKDSRCKLSVRTRCKACVKIVSTINHLRNHTKRLAQMSKYKKNNSGKMNALSAKRHSAKLQRTPKWLTSLHYSQIEMFYDAAQRLTTEFGIPMDVDHIVPLQGKNVSGLHVPWNLQVITEQENANKYNRINN